MPGELIRVRLDEINNERARKIALHRKYLAGEPPFPRLDVQDPNGDKPRYVVGYPRMILNRYVDALFGAEQFDGFAAFSFSDQRLAGSLFEKVWRDNTMDVLLDELAEDSILCGEGFLDVVYNSEELGEDRIALRPYRPELVTVVENALGEVTCYVIMWWDETEQCYWRKEIRKNAVYVYKGELKREEVGKRGLIFKEPVYNETVLFSLQRDLSVVHNLGFFTVVRVRHKTPLFDGAISKFDALNEVFTNLMYAISQQADPLLYVKGISRMDEVYRDADAVWYFTNPQASVDVLQWEGTPQAVFETVKHVTAQLFRLVGIPVESVLETKDVIDKPYRSLRLLYSDFLARVGRYRRDYEIFFNELWRTVAAVAENKALVEREMGGMEPREQEEPAGESGLPDLKCAVRWGDVIEEDMASWRDFVVEKLYGKGLVTKERAVKMMCLDDEDELLKELAGLEEEARREREEELRLMVEQARTMRAGG
jgi:hypothetical protein